VTKKILVLVTLALVFTAAPIFAQGEDKPFRVAIVDLNRLLTESSLGKASQARLQNFYEAKQTELQQEYQALQREGASLENQRSVLAADAYTAKRNQLEQKTLAFRQKSEEAEREFKKMQQEETGKFLTAMAPIIDSLGKEGSYTLILRRSAPAVLYYDPAIDVTDEVLRRLDASAQSQ